MKVLLTRLGSIALALLLAVVVWVVSVQQENPRDRYAQPIPVSRTGLSDNLSIFGETVSHVRVELRAPRQRWADLQPSSFTAWVDLSGLGPGAYDLKVQVTPPDPQVQVLSVEPSAIHVRLERSKQRLMPVRANILDSPAFGYDWRAAIITPTQVLVSGSASVVDQVNNVSVDVYLRSTRSTVERTLRVSAYDASGEPVGFASVSPRDVNVTVPVVQLPGYREVAILVETMGGPASGYTVNGVNADPKLVTLFGDPGVISELSGYITVSVDINNASQNIVERVPLRLPQNVSTLSRQSVTVEVSISPISGAQTVRRTPVIQGLGPALTYTLPLDSVTVFLAGPVPKLEALRPDAVPVIVDLAGRGVGVHVVEPQVPSPEGITVQGVSPQSVEVEILPAPIPPTPTAVVTPSPSPQATSTEEPTVTPTPTVSPTPTRRR